MHIIKIEERNVYLILNALRHQLTLLEVDIKALKDNYILSDYNEVIGVKLRRKDRIEGIIKDIEEQLECVI